MLIEHVAIWVSDIELMKSFYEKYFGCSSNKKYRNENTSFESYFLSFKSGARLELMKKPGIPYNQNNAVDQYQGIIHIAIKIGNREGVDRLTQLLENDGYTVLQGPRETGDGYYESCILDPENNRIEIVC